MKESENQSKLYIDPNMRETADGKPVGMGYTSYVDVYRNNSYHPHWHDEFEVVYVQKGIICMYINGSEYYLKEGDGAFIITAAVCPIRSALCRMCCSVRRLSADMMSFFTKNILNR